jgi:hypothetical protein
LITGWLARLTVVPFLTRQPGRRNPTEECTMILPLPTRDPAGPLEPKHLITLASNARQLVATIRAYLPVVGEIEPKAHRLTIDRWYDQAVRLYTRCERIRNAAEIPYRRGLSSSSVNIDAAEGSGPAYMELGHALDALCEHYRWQGVSDNSRHPMSNCRGGGTIESIPGGLLDAIDQPANWLYELNKGMESLPPTGQERLPTHSEDFTSVNWYGTDYRFTKGLQAESVRALWEAWENKTPTLSQETIGKRAGSSASSFQLAKVFRRKKKRGGYSPHPAWGTMIQPGAKGTYQLIRPKETN